MKYGFYLLAGTETVVFTSDSYVKDVFEAVCDGKVWSGDQFEMV